MKTLFTSLLLLIGLGYGLAQRIDLNGQISIHNSHYRTGQIEYVANAYVQAPFAGSTNSYSDGQFRLTFEGIEGGTVIKLAVEKAGLEVVNTYDLERVVLGQKPKLLVYLARKGRLAEAQTELYNISKEALFARRDAIIARLLGEKAESDAAMAELERDWGFEIGSIGEAIELLDSKIEELQKRLPEFAQELAAKNLDFASELYIQAYELYQAGDIEGAILVLDDAKLEQSYQAALVSIEKGKSLEEVGRELQEKGKLQIEQLVESYHLKAEGHNLLFEYREAAAALRKVIDILAASTNTETLELADTYGQLGRTFQNWGKYAEALAANLKNTALKERLLADDDTELATSYNNLATTYKDLGKYQLALNTLKRSLIVLASNPNPKLSAIIQSNLASTYQALGKYEQALNTQKRALSVFERVIPTDHQNVAAAHANLSLVYLKLKEYALALAEQKKSLLILEKSLPEDHPNIAAAHNIVSTIYLTLKNYKAAFFAQKKALAIREQVLDPSHPAVATSYNNLAQIYLGLGDKKQALAAQKDALNIFEKIFPPAHPSIAVSYENLAYVYQGLKNYKLALEAQQEALTRKKLASDPDNQGIARSYNNLARIHVQITEYNEALLAQKSALEILEPFLGYFHSDVGICYYNLSSIHQYLGNYNQAFTTGERAIEIQEKVLSHNHSELATSYHNMVAIYYHFQKIDSAIEFQRRAYNIWEDTLPKTHPNLKTAKDGLAYLYHKRATQRRAAGKYPEAIEDYQHALTFSKDQGKLLNQLGLTYYYAQDYEQAIESYKSSYQLEGISDTVYLSNSGMAYAKWGEFKEAKTCFSQLQELIPNDGLSYRDWGFYYTIKGEPDTALDHLEQAIQRGYDDWEWLRTEAALDPLRDHPRFKALLAQDPNGKE